VSGSDLNRAQVGADCREITSELPRMLHSVLSHFLNNRVSHKLVSSWEGQILLFDILEFLPLTTSMIEEHSPLNTVPGLN
jgi:hypothetical protein